MKYWHLHLDMIIQELQWGLYCIKPSIASWKDLIIEGDADEAKKKREYFYSWLETEPTLLISLFEE